MIYAEVIGDPIVQSKSPMIHGFWLRKLGIKAEYRACHVRSEALADYFVARNNDDDWRGCNVTMPHKQATIPCLDRIEDEAARIGAVNTVTMEDNLLVGANTDAPGFMEPLRPFLTNQTRRFASLIGAGGAARAIADALHNAGFTLISYSRDPAKAEREIGRFIRDKDLILPMPRFPRQPGCGRIPAEPDRIDILVNTTPLGMMGHPHLQWDFSDCVEDEIVYDIVTHPVDTTFLKSARAAGLRTIDGLAMLIGQAAVAFEKFFGQPAPREFDTELRALLTA